MSAPPRPSDELLLQLIREQRQDSEIALRLGVTTAQVRERKTELRNRLGPQRYAQLTGAASGRRLSGRSRLFLGGMGLAAGLLAILLVIANIVAGEEGDEAPARVAPGASPATASLLPPSLVAVDGVEYLDLGNFLVSGSSDAGPVGTVFNRLALTAIELRSTTYAGGSPHIAWELVSSSRTDAFLRGTLAGRQLDVALYTQRPGGRIRTVAAGVGPLLEIQAESGFPLPPTIILVVTEGGLPVRARLLPDGTLLIAPAPLPPEAVFDAYTGHALDVSHAIPFGQLPTTFGRFQNGCNGAPPPPHPRAGTVSCRVSWGVGRGYAVPFEGTLSCSGPRSLRYEGGGVRLEFFLVDQPGTSFACEPSRVSAGQGIVPFGEWILAATVDGVGEVSVVVALDGRVYVGEVRGEASCPCLPRPT